VRLSLGLRVLTLVGTVNVAVFGAGLYYLSGKIASDRLLQEQEFAKRLVHTLRGSISPAGELRVAQILQWPFWGAVSDVVVIDRNPHGVSLNPIGAAGRGADFDRELIEDGLSRAVETRSEVPIAGGLALPIVDDRERVWGGLWFQVSNDSAPLWRGLLPWFFASTVLLFLGTFYVLRRYVLNPVGLLAGGARLVQHGELGRQVTVPAHSDELSDLIETFNKMSADVRGFHEHLEEKVDAATEKALTVEAAAMRQRRLAAMGELAAGIAHEINNPLGGMLNAVDVIERADTPLEKRARYHELLRGGLERIQGTVAKLLRFTPREAELAPLELAEPVRDAIELVRHRVEQQGVELVERLDARGCPVLGQRSELGQAVLNLLANALDALEESRVGGRIEVRLEGGAEEVVLSVTDDGPGVDDSSLERVSDLFYTTKEVGRGTGLGLALVHNVVASHGGRVQLTNMMADGGDQSGVGFRVQLVLPRHRSGEGGAV
jgi:signal transduction histidine kinase